jgi:hypothetical protein
MQRAVGLALNIEIRILHAGVHLAIEGAAKEIGKAEVRAALAPLVIERCFVSGDQIPAGFDELPKLGALGIGESCDIRKNQSPEIRQTCAVQQAIVHHLEGNARLNQRLIEAGGVIVNFLRLPVAA